MPNGIKIAAMNEKETKILVNPIISVDFRKIGWTYTMVKKPNSTPI
jgi:hypothetical protein